VFLNIARVKNLQKMETAKTVHQIPKQMPLFLLKINYSVINLQLKIILLAGKIVIYKKKTKEKFVKNVMLTLQM